MTALQYTIDNPFGGVTSLEALPFIDSDGTTTEPCPLTTGSPLAVVVPQMALAVSSTSPTDPNDRVTQMKQGLAQQPLVVMMDATCTTFEMYSSGIMTDDGNCSCASGSCIDHAVLMVGYDDTTNPPSFKIKNSLGYWLGRKWLYVGCLYCRFARCCSSLVWSNIPCLLLPSVRRLSRCSDCIRYHAIRPFWIALPRISWCRRFQFHCR